MVCATLILTAFIFSFVVGPWVIPESKRAGLYAPLVIMTSYALIAWCTLRVVRRYIVLSLSDQIPNERTGKTVDHK